MKQWFRRRSNHPIFGYLAEFDGAEPLKEAARRARAAGYREMEAYTPLPIHGLPEILGYRNNLPKIVLVGGIVGMLAGFALQYYASVVSYPMNVGGRPDNSWPSFIVVTFEMTILFAAAACVLGMLALNGLPMPYHPVFNVPIFELASRNRFFLLILSRDAHFDMQRTHEFLEQQPSLVVEEVPY